MLTRTLRRGAVDARITCLSHSSRRRLLWAVALPVSPLRISLAPGQCQVASPVEEVWGGLLAEAFVVHSVRGGVGDRTANAIESILRRTGCSTLAVNWAKNGLDPTLCLHVLLANRNKRESRRADSNRWPNLITSDHSGVAGVCRGLQIPYI